jgi:hypothetical protein
VLFVSIRSYYILPISSQFYILNELQLSLLRICRRVCGGRFRGDVEEWTNDVFCGFVEQLADDEVCKLLAGLFKVGVLDQ